MTDKCVIIQVEAVEQIAEIRDKAMRKIESSPLKEFADWCEVAQLLDWICGTIEASPEPESAEPVANYIELTTAEALQHLRDRGLVDIDNHEMSGLYKLVINPDWKPSPPE